MSRETLIALAGGALSAMASMAVFLSGSAGALLVVYLAPLPLLLVGLSLGPRAASMACAGGFLVAGVLGGMMAGGLYGLIHALPAWLVTRQALKQGTAADGRPLWYPAGSILCSLTALAAAGILFTAVLGSGHEGGMRALIADYLETFVSAVMPNADAADRNDIVAVLAPPFPGFIGIFWVMVTVLNVTLAQSILRRLGRNLRPDFSVADLELPDWSSWLLVGAAVMALLGPWEMEYIGRNLVLLLLLPFFLLGLAVVHAVARRVTFPGMLLTIFYLILVFSKALAMAVAGVGLIEQWVGLRKRFANPGGASGVE